ncbi:MAG TPA: sensor histidine kinase KdpD [Lachnoclostridium phytofermentans]|uniref:histidine kinase n=1 Tax=Lachnoclostridium phytofermentans TaxID=66219 RepID=A0A3D2X7N8_9FIRM|nr:sensor histidine kinase KdpD [Lachnoclostridium sp.]HCL03131.1 sensor histidine kinase KdpD [Lachnoclostridium phytofermentans]
MQEERANPDELLRRLYSQGKNDTRGQLKIFFGYAAGVGKTYTMLEAAHVAKSKGQDVVVGYVEPHKRPQTAKLLEGLECIPVRDVNHKGITLKEFDLDAAIRRKPQIILVDELAHTNADTCRHIKRYQDIEELLKAGIDVYTTVNVQHIESLNDIVASITGIMVRERIPDHVFDNADQVELVDIEPTELIERLHNGLIYGEAQVKKALGNFFSEENLVAMREIALRRCADRVNKISDKQRIAQGTEYFTEEHILVCISSSPTNGKIIRTAARMANAFKGSFTALFVETPDFSVLSDENKKSLKNNMRLAQQLGATIETVYGDDIALQISEFARISGVSKIVLGRNNAKRKYFFGKPSLTERLTILAPNMDIYIIPDKDAVLYKVKKFKKQKDAFIISDVIKSIVILAFATMLGFLFYELGFSEANIITVYILSVLITAIVTTQRSYSLVSSVVSVLVFNFFFTIPRYTLSAYDGGYPATFLIMFLSAFITSSLAVKIKQHAKQAAQTAYRTKILLETNQLIQKQKNREGIISVIASQLTKLLQRDIIYYDADAKGLKEPILYPAKEDVEDGNYNTENEKAVAVWVYKNNKHAGATTNTLGNAKCFYLAVRVNENVYGVLGIAMHGESLDVFEHSIVLSILGECALALENERIRKEREDAEVLAKNEQLRANLLRSISHDLRTPLTSISGNAGVLLSNEDTLSVDKKRDLYNDIYDDSLWLINLVENLLSVTRIEDGTMSLRLTTELVEEVVTEALQYINRKSAKHTIKVIQEEEILLAKMDARLIIQVIINIIDNAIKYTPAGSHIILTVKKEKPYIIFEIADDGNGLSKEAKDKVFDMFYTANTTVADSRRSLGLGLALCKSIITAHGGEISVYDNIPKGTVFRFTIPTEEVNLHE